MKRFKGNKINKPLMLMLLAVLAINNGWMTAQTDSGTSAAEFASKKKKVYYLDINTGNKRLVVEHGSEDDPTATVPDKDDDEVIVIESVDSKNGKQSPEVGQGTVLKPAERPEQSKEQIGNTTRTTKNDTVKIGQKQKDLVSVPLPVDTGKGSYEITISKECTYYKDTNEERCRVYSKVDSKQRKSLLKAHGVDSDDIDKIDKELENCKCLDIDLERTEIPDYVAKPEWFQNIRDIFERKYSDLVDSHNGKKKKTAKNKKGGKLDEKDEKLQKKIDACEIAETSTVDKEEKLTKEDLYACIERRVSELGDADKDTKEGREKIALLNKLVGKVKGHLKKCLANEEHREDTGCLELAEAIKDATEGSDVKGVHNISHQMDIMIAQGYSSVENTKVMEQLKQLRSGMANASQVAQRTGNYGPMMSYQQRLGQLHQYFLSSQMRREQYLRNWELDPELGMTSMNDINNDYMLMSRIEEEFQNAATPNRRMGMNGMNGMNQMGRYGMPPYGAMGQMMPGMMNPMMMNQGMMMPGMMNPMMMNQGMMNPMMGMRPPMMPYNPMMPMSQPGMMNGMMPGMMPGMMSPYAMMQRPPFMPYGSQFGMNFQMGINGGFPGGGMPMGGSYGIYPQAGMGPGGFPGQPFGGPGIGPTAGYYPPNPYQAPSTAPASTINTR